MTDVFTEDRRLAILLVLRGAPGYSANGSILQAALGQIGHRVSRDQVRTELAWLAEQALVTVEDLGDIHVVKLTGRGLEVAAGDATVPGVKKPRPR